jgi:hypothetical protein
LAFLQLKPQKYMYILGYTPGKQHFEDIENAP